ncbi:hypothetical protein AB0D90_32310 [Streptomyces althioticus]|uniref:hypothetical protein n=1 Tax=Streptomyces althioticus TaxID=83380 RepID=UPI0033D07E7B
MALAANAPEPLADLARLYAYDVHRLFYVDERGMVWTAEGAHGPGYLPAIDAYRRHVADCGACYRAYRWNAEGRMSCPTGKTLHTEAHSHFKPDWQWANEDRIARPRQAPAYLHRPPAAHAHRATFPHDWPASALNADDARVIHPSLCRAPDA